jgi:hypothetical protein
LEGIPCTAQGEDLYHLVVEAADRTSEVEMGQEDIEVDSGVVEIGQGSSTAVDSQ